jgi:hypothetical protein
VCLIDRNVVSLIDRNQTLATFLPYHGSHSKGKQQPTGSSQVTSPSPVPQMDAAGRDDPARHAPGGSRPAPSRWETSSSDPKEVRTAPTPLYLNPPLHQILRDL